MNEDLKKKLRTCQQIAASKTTRKVRPPKKRGGGSYCRADSLRAARLLIVAAANVGRDPVVKEYTLRNINLAVHKVRGTGKVKASVLEAAGFRS